jgi:hypothetical protein
VPEKAYKEREEGMISNWICLLATVDEILLLKFQRRNGVSLRPAFFSAHRIYEVFSSYPGQNISTAALWIKGKINAKDVLPVASSKTSKAEIAS